MVRRRLERRFRVVLGGFLLALVLSGLTAFPLLGEVRLLDRLLGDAGPPSQESLRFWIGYVHEGLEVTYARYPFVAYGTDWLAFAHLAIAVFFIGPLVRPTEHDWTLLSGLIACGGVLLLAMICGPIRGIPWAWRLIDSSFGVFGSLPLAYCFFLSQKMKALSGEDP